MTSHQYFSWSRLSVLELLTKGKKFSVDYRDVSYRVNTFNFTPVFFKVNREIDGLKVK